MELKINHKFMRWIITAIIVSIPFLHLWLHALLAWWRKRPYLYYLIFCPLVWLAAILFFKNIDSTFPSLLFSPTQLVSKVGKILMLLGLVAIISSVITLGPKRFFMWAVLRPESVRRTRVTRGPFAFLPHPAYFGYLTVAFGNFLSSGKFYLSAVFALLFALTPIVIWFEEKELSERIDKK